MLTNDLFKKILLEPAQKGGETLYIVSGYASPAMAYEHLNSLSKFKIKLLVGMSGRDGIGNGQHKAFKAIEESDFLGRFECRYLIRNFPPVHLKCYAWTGGGKYIAGFTGSANYTQQAFRKEQLEAMALDSPNEIFDLYHSLKKRSISCLDPKVASLIDFFDERNLLIKGGGKDKKIERKNLIEGLDYVTISLFDRYGMLPQRSGLNWGQRPELNREPNQAYLRIPAAIYKIDFFPEIGKHFLMLTDDGESLDCVRAQDNGKAIHTYRSNSILGKYFRNRLGIKSGELIKTEDLNRYGRSDVTIYKIDEDNYYMDFSL